MAKTNTIRSNSLQTNSVRLNGVEGLRRVSLQAGEIPDIPPTYTLSASVTNGKVSAKRNGSAVNLPFTANEGDVIVLSVTPNDGYAFEGWNDGNTDNPRSITMTADVALSAQCVEVVAPSKYIQFEDAEVERVLMSKGVSSDGVGITIEDAEKVTSIDQWFRENNTIKSFDEFKYFKGVTSLVNDAFANAKNLETISLPPNCTIIGSAAFWKCSNLTTINGLEQVKSVGIQAFLTVKITSLSLPNYQGAIAERAFSYCTNLELADLGEGVTQLSGEVFSSDTILSTLIVRATTPPTLVGANFFQCPLSVIYVPDASLEAYKTATNWNTYADRIHPLSEIEDYYVSDALLMHLDGINKGNVEGEWQDLVSGNTFVNHGAVAEADGWRFDGASSYMDSATMVNYGPAYKDRTFEIVVEFERENITEVVYMGQDYGYAFGRYVGGKCIILSAVTAGIPSFADDMTSGVRIFSASLSNFQLVASEINGKDGQVRGDELFSGSDSFIYLGKRASGSHFKGIIHSIRIHDRALSKEEILYNQRIDNKRFNLGLDI